MPAERVSAPFRDWQQDLPHVNDRPLPLQAFNGGAKVNSTYALLKIREESGFSVDHDKIKMEAQGLEFSHGDGGGEGLQVWQRRTRRVWALGFRGFRGFAVTPGEGCKSLAASSKCKINQYVNNIKVEIYGLASSRQGVRTPGQNAFDA
ncbi:hypothetical protein C8R44DRAFT_732102 [Mycena epipterygia]|nr:hypothetical protein C8R44DRAFT_732102 [Mycena epipterygia]